ncbi:MAG: PIN domain-containing protein [Betaproteobacteria bacterium]
MSGADFLDTNVFVYLVDEASPAKQAIARQLVRDAHAHHSGVISFQVVQESLQVITRKFKVVARRSDAADFLRDVLVPLWQVMPSPALYEKALGLQERHEFSFYDSLIVAAALEAGCRRLLSEDLQHGQRIEGLRIENPFR